MAKSTYYYKLNKVDAVIIRNKPVLKVTKTIFTGNKRLYGTRRIYNELIEVSK
ncbi:hypothetical protein [Gemella morbillorum]|uniref:hypothetical protein n=1 Tax=Gemella morbillorum TaxID=29391 RepID=UPI0023F4802A|nr:hypothetical protein [Gemella morbillorum]